MKRFFLYLLIAITASNSSIAQADEKLSCYLPGLDPSVYLLNARTAFKKLNIQVIEDADGHLYGRHQQKTFYIGPTTDPPVIGYIVCQGFPLSALEKMANQLKAFILNRTEPSIPIPEIEIDVLNDKNSPGYIEDVYKPRARIIEENQEINVVFANLPAYADKIVIASINDPAEKWINGYLKNLYNGKLKDDATANSGAINFEALPQGKYEARVLSELSAPAKDRKYRILQGVNFEVTPNELGNTGSLILMSKTKTETGKFYPAKLKIKIYKGNSPVTDVDCYDFFSTERIWAPFQEIPSCQLAPGKYDVEFAYHYMSVFKKDVVIFKNKVTQLSAGEENGHLTINFLSKDDHLVEKKNCSITINSGDKEIFSKKYSSLKTESGELVTGDYTITIEYDGKKQTKKIHISPSVESFFNIMDKQEEAALTGKEGFLNLSMQDCSGASLPLSASVLKDGKQIMLISENTQKINSKKTIPVKPGIYTVIFSNSKEDQSSMPVARNIEIKAKQNSTIAFEQSAMGKLTLKASNKESESDFFKLEIRPLEKQIIYNDAGDPRSLYSNWITISEKNNYTRLLSPGKYKILLSQDKGKTLVKEITINPCNETNINYPADISSATGILELTQLDCNGNQKMVCAKIWQNNRLIEFYHPENNKEKNLIQKLELTEGKYDVIFSSCTYYDNPFSHSVKRTVEITPGKTTAVSFNEKEVGRLKVIFNTKEGDRTEVRITINAQGKTPFYTQWGEAIYSYQNTLASTPDGLNNILEGMIYPGKYTLIAEIRQEDESFQTFTKDLIITPCSDTKLEFPDKSAACDNKEMSNYFGKALYFGMAIGLINSDVDSSYRENVSSFLQLMRNGSVNYMECGGTMLVERLDHLIAQFDQMNYRELRKVINKKTLDINGWALKNDLECNFYKGALINIFDGASSIGQAMGIAYYYQQKSTSIPEAILKHIRGLLSSANNSLIKYSSGCFTKLDPDILTMNNLPADPDSLLNLLNKLDYSSDPKCCCKCIK